MKPKRLAPVIAHSFGIHISESKSLVMQEDSSIIFATALNGSYSGRRLAFRNGTRKVLPELKPVPSGTSQAAEPYGAYRYVYGNNSYWFAFLTDTKEDTRHKMVKYYFDMQTIDRDKIY